MNPLSLTLLILTLINITQSKFYSFWASFDNCQFSKGCKYKTNQAKIKGFAKGVSPTTELWDDDFMICEEYYFLCGYLPLEAKETVSANSGVTIGIGVDLGSKTEQSFQKMQVSPLIIEKIKPYFGLKGEKALDALLKFSNLTLSDQEASELSHKVKLFYYNELSSQYNSDINKCETCVKSFSLLNPSIRTALFSLYYNTGKIKYTNLWTSILTNDWLEVAKNIETFKSNKSRRLLEGLLIRSTLNKCSKQMYTSFLLDESGSIDSTDFQKAKNFIISYIQQTNFTYNNISIVSFDSDFNLISDFTNNSQILIDGLNDHKQTRGSTETGEAIRKANILFKHLHNNGSLKVMIVITDGNSDNPAQTKTEAQTSRDNGINIVAMGIGNNINQNELFDISGGLENVFNVLDYSSINIYLETLMSSVCNQNTPVQNNNTVSTRAKDFDSPLYFEVKKLKNTNEKIILAPQNGQEEEMVNIFASYSNPFPSANDFDLAHFGGNKGVKEMVVAGNITRKEENNFVNNRMLFFDVNNNFERVNIKQLNSDEEEETLYLSVYGRDLDFDLKTEECDPAICKQGTNDSNTSSWVVYLVIGVAMMGIAGAAFYYFLYYRKRSQTNHSIAFDKLI